MTKEEKQLLPALPQAYNRKYFVQTADMDLTLLFDSGYTFFHRPYFAMYACTRAAYTLNPHAKLGTDAAPKAAQAISFREFLQLFENESSG